MGERQSSTRSSDGVFKSLNADIMVILWSLGLDSLAKGVQRTYTRSMSNVHLGSASHRNAKQSRRLGVSGRTSNRVRRAWIRRFRRTRQSIDRSLRLIEASGR